MASMGYKVGDVMDEDDAAQKIPELDLDTIYESVMKVGALLEDDTLDKAQSTIWTIKTSMPFVNVLINRLPPLLDTVIDALQEAARIRGLPVVTRADMTEDYPGITEYDDLDDARQAIFLSKDPPVDQVDDVDVDDPEGDQ